MPTGRSGKREDPLKDRLRRTSTSLVGSLTWIDFGAGICTALGISLLLVGFWYQAIPEFRLHDFASQDVRALQDLNFEDSASTIQKKEAARNSVPVLYELNTTLISSRENALSKAFSEARDLLARRKVNAQGNVNSSEQTAVLRELQNRVGETFPSTVLPLLLRQRFNPALEEQILRVLDTVLRNGIIADRTRFFQDQHNGIVLRDSSTAFERPLTDALMVRDLPAARNYLNQFHLEFSNLPAHERSELVQFMETLLVPTLVANERETLLRRDAAAERVQPVEIHIEQGKMVVRRGEEITSGVASQIEALRNLQRPRSLLRQWGGFFFFVVVFMYALWRYFVFYQTRHQKIRNHMALILSVLAIVLVVTRLATALADVLSERLAASFYHDPFNLYYGIPFALGSILVTLLVDVNLGIMVSVVLSILVGLFYGDAYLAAYLLVGSLAGIYSIRQYKDRAAILKAGLTIGVVNFFALTGIGLLKEMPLTFSVAWERLGVALLSGMLSAALASMLLPLLESTFRITTDIRLLELSNLNAPVLRRLAVEAPGTYHHSLMVGTLAEAAAEAIGANPLLARVGAYYHDLGKMIKPEYFVENQAFGINRHESLTPSMSCLIIASHVKDGVELAKEVRLPERIRDMIPQHHGTRIMTFFYQKAKDSQGGKGQDLEDRTFRYPGPKPQSKEAAIMMMADSVEAASRTLSNPAPGPIQGMIDRLIDAMVADNQFDECDITLREVRQVKESCFKILTAIHHQRIEYPGYDFKEIVSESESLTRQGSDLRQAKAI